MDGGSWVITIIGWIATIVISIVGAKKTAESTILAAEEEFLIKNNKEDIEKAIELAGVFAEQIIPMSSYITLLYNNIADKTLLQKISKYAEAGCELEFDVDEAQKLFDITFKKNEFTLLEMQVENLQIPHFTFARKILISGTFKNLIEYNDKIIANGKLQEDEQRKIYMYEFINIKTTLLNTLEHFSMYFCSKLAKDETVYQSLHQEFRSCCCMLYFDICKINNKWSDKYFTNIIELFTIWNKEYCVRKSSEEQIKEKEGLQAIEENTKLAKKDIVRKPGTYK